MPKTVLNLIMTFDGYVAGMHDEMGTEKIELEK